MYQWFTRLVKIIHEEYNIHEEYKICFPIESYFQLILLYIVRIIRFRT